MGLSKHWLKTENELEVFLKGANLTVYLSKDIAGNSFHEMTGLDIEELFARSHLLWGCSANEYAFVSRIAPKEAISLVSAIELASAESELVAAVLVPYQDGGIILLTQEKYSKYATGVSANWWRFN